VKSKPIEDVVEPIASGLSADVYLPTGEISDTLVHPIAKDAYDNGRPLVMFTLADCDPYRPPTPNHAAKLHNIFEEKFGEMI
jgi:hypothetical protein